ncbi:hypothetical protein C8R46DRAFT_257826 [Mycena filopes]|nr:hypothetical protein C8R46DRAFT_257826 [Mycena filopes]
MPIFNSASRFQINGGVFYDVQTGDVNINHQAVTSTALSESNTGPPTQARALLEGSWPRTSNDEWDARRRYQSSDSSSSRRSRQTSVPPSLGSIPESFEQGQGHSRDVDAASEADDEAFFSPQPPGDLLQYSDPTTTIHGGTFITGNVNQIQNHSESGIHILYRAVATDAFHNSQDRYPQPSCHPETRKELLTYLWDWSTQMDPERAILWLHGPAGSGKSAIAQSFAQSMESSHRPWASFFFKRGNPWRGRANRSISTICYQLAILLPAFKQVVSHRVEADPSILDRSPSMQMQTLIVDPCRATMHTRPIVTTLIIDGLDECEDLRVQQEILHLLGAAVQKNHLPLRVLVASRPERHLCDVFDEDSFRACSDSLWIDQSFKDVRTYLEKEFERIHSEHYTTMASTPLPWPSGDVMDALVTKSSGYFIYAQLVV